MTSTLSMPILMMSWIDHPMEPTMDRSEQLRSRCKLTSVTEVKPNPQALPCRSHLPRLCCLLSLSFVCYFVCFCLCS